MFVSDLIPFRSVLVEAKQEQFILAEGVVVSLTMLVLRPFFGSLTIVARRLLAYLLLIMNGETPVGGLCTKSRGCN